MLGFVVEQAMLVCTIFKGTSYSFEYKVVGGSRYYDELIKFKTNKNAFQ